MFQFETPAAGIIRISVIIPARNEENNIGSLLAALEQQSYDPELFETIVIDDHSSDRTTEIVQEYPRVRLLRLQKDQINSYKKEAIAMGIQAAKNELIVTTDADCLPGKYWLETIAAFKQSTNAVFIAAPVVLQNGHSWLEIFQALDFLTLQGITGAVVYNDSLSMSNGANLAYEKIAFTETGGFEGIDGIASGDDMLLMGKIKKKFPGKTFYLKSEKAIVATSPMNNWKSFINQRIRWASKARYYDDKKIFFILLLVFLFNLFFLLLCCMGFYHYSYWILLAALWVAKTAIEYPFVSAVAEFFNKRKLMRYLFLFQPFHILYMVTAGLLGQVGTYEWKGRNVK